MQRSSSHTCMFDCLHLMIHPFRPMKHLRTKIWHTTSNTQCYFTYTVISQGPQTVNLRASSCHLHFYGAHDPVKTGCRFSANALRPSKRSLVGMTCTKGTCDSVDSALDHFSWAGHAPTCSCMENERHFFHMRVYNFSRVGRAHLRVIRVLQGIAALQVHLYAAIDC